MLMLRYRPSKALVLLGAITLILTACDADEAAQSGGEEAWSGADAPADATMPAEQFGESEFMGPVDVSTDLAAAAPTDEVSPPAVDPVAEIVMPGPADLQTATFALG